MVSNLRVLDELGSYLVCNSYSWYQPQSLWRPKLQPVQFRYITDFSHQISNNLHEIRHLFLQFSHFYSLSSWLQLIEWHTWSVLWAFLLRILLCRALLPDVILVKFCAAFCSSVPSCSKVEALHRNLLLNSSKPNKINRLSIRSVSNIGITVAVKGFGIRLVLY